ncbi:AIPR family protein [Streptomyces sp. MAR4 CNX-425]|uniref:AIPR family protein n=1 Tax=Streptomyces sp. MAR4 CNX-425 TaxID=3406343 RepID=UPI003B50A6D3
MDQIMQQRQAERATPLPADEAFEIFACEQALRDFDLSADEVVTGVVGGGNDGAIDGVYVFLGSSLLEEDSDVFDAEFSPSSIAVGTRLLLWLVQAKQEDSFTETAIDLVSSSASRLLNLGEPEDDLKLLYSNAVVDRVAIFRRALQKLAIRHPSVEVRFSYVTRGKKSEINAKVEAKAKQLESQFTGLVPNAVGYAEFLGAAELWAAASRVPSYTLKLTYLENATSGTSHVALVTLKDYLGFLSDDAGLLRRHIFDWNVRDYQGDVEVNQEIRESLLDENGAEFWWLNNGVTIICSKTSIVSKTYILDDVQIVNGLQTSHTIYRALTDLQQHHPAFSRSVLVRILVTEDPGERDRVIRATNRQTAVPAASLRATDEIQREIEAYFLANGWFYDRRKNYYRNIGKSAERIVGIPLLAQSVMAMGLSQPHNSRARPSSLLKRNDEYSRIFSKKIDLPIYLWVAQRQKEIDLFLLTTHQQTSASERTNLRFHLSMVAATRLLGKRIYAPTELRELAAAQTDFSSLDLNSVLGELREHYSEYAKVKPGSMEKSAKSGDFVSYIFAQIEF